MQRLYFAIAVVLLLGLTTALPAQRATIKQEKTIIKTYPFGEPNPVPILARGATMWGPSSRLYPYFTFNKFSTTGRDVEWKFVHLENPYIDVYVTPEIGGKIWGAFEKSTKNDFIYFNHVIKFREIAMRGPWTSGGIELNFGVIGHSATCGTPVDYLLRKNSDGSVSCIVGAMDLPSRTRWSVTITLPPDKAFFETNTLWYNPSPVDQAYYCWMNSAADARMDLQYVSPGHFSIEHDFNKPLKPWPVDENGRDLSWYKNNNFGSHKSYFTIGEYKEFSGGYWHNRQFGYGHWALFDDMPGRKTWLWALSRQGGIWEDLLTDVDGQYIEPQVGRLYNQNDHQLFTPYTADLWREVWFPYKEIGLMTAASPYAALNVTKKDHSITLSLCPLQSLDDDLVVSADGKEIYREHLKLLPMEVYRKTLPLTVEKGNLLVNINNKLSYSDDPHAKDLHRPINFHHYDESTLEGLYLNAQRYASMRNYHAAINKYLACIEKDPQHIRALSGVAELYYRQTEYAKALEYARQALEIDMYYPHGNYIYGIISRRLGNLIDTKETLGWAARSMKYRSGAYCQMAEIFLLEHNLKLALEYSQRALDFNKYNINAYQVRATAYRKLQQPRQAREILAQILEIEPLNHFARFEGYLLDPSRKNLEKFQSMIRNELPHESYLETAMFYVNVGLDNDAVELLKAGPDYPTIYYWLAYLLKEKSPQQSKKYLKKAVALSPHLVFPFRSESIPVFKWAIETDPTDWKSKYYLGLIYWYKGRKVQTRQLFDNCGQTNADYGPFYITRGCFYQDIDLQKTQADFKYALKIEPESWNIHHHLIGFYRSQKMFDKALDSARKAAELFPDEIRITVDWIGALMDNDIYDEALSLIEKNIFLPYEGERAIHDMFVQCNLKLAYENIRQGNYSTAARHLENAKKFPEQLGAGKPYDVDNRIHDYLIALCYDKTGNKNKAKQVRNRIHDYEIWIDNMLNKDGFPSEVLEIIKREN